MTVDLSKLGKAGFRMYEASKAREHMPSPRSVIDLHIDKLTDHWTDLSSMDILAMQLSHFEKYYELAVANMLPEMVVIHGVGEGRLRDEIHERLRHKQGGQIFRQSIPSPVWLWRNRNLFQLIEFLLISSGIQLTASLILLCRR